MYVVGDIEVHEKFSILKDGKYANFIRNMNVFSLAVNSPIFGCCVAVKLSRAVASWENWEWESERKREWDRKNFREREIYRYLLTWPASNARFIFSKDKFFCDSKSVDVVEDTTYDHSVQPGSRNLLIYFDA